MESFNWQTRLSTVRERTQYAFKKSLFCDVEFTVVDSANGGKVSIPANKYMLAVSSPVFEAMFYGNLKEKKDTIDLQDCTKEGLQELLRFVHSDEVNLTGNNVMEVLYIADKYIMPFLTMKCREYLKENLKPEEVFTVLPQVKKLSDKELVEHCWKVIDNKTYLAMSSKPFLEISREILSEVLTRDTLKTKELDIFRAVDKWATSTIKRKELECTGDSKRTVLGEDIIRLIRFPLISQEELAEVVLPCNILERQELIELFQFFGKVSLSTSIFNRKKRGSEYKLTENRFLDIHLPESNVYFKKWSYGDRDMIDAIDFFVSKPASLGGVQIFGSQGSTYNIELQILKNTEVLSNLCLSYSSEMVNDKYYGFTAELDKPVSLEPKVFYTIWAVIDGPVSYYGKSGEDVVERGDLAIIYRSSDLDDNGTSDFEGQFPSLLLSIE